MPSMALSHRQSWHKNIAHLPVVKQVVGFLWASLYVVTLLSLLSYDPADLGFNVYPPNAVPSNFIGYVGASLAGVLFYTFGFGAYIIASLCGVCSLASFLGMEIRWRWKPLWFALFILSACCLLDLQTFVGSHVIQRVANFDSAGGLIGVVIIGLTVPYALGKVGAAVLFFTILSISAIYLFNVNPVVTTLGAFSWYRNWCHRREEQRLANASPHEQLTARQQHLRNKIEELQKKAALEPAAPVLEEEEPEPEPPMQRVHIHRPEEPEETEPPPARPAKPTFTPSATATLSPARATALVMPDYELPSLDLLAAPAGRARDSGPERTAAARESLTHCKNPGPLRRPGHPRRHHARRDHHPLRSLPRRRRARGQDQQPVPRSLARALRRAD